MDFLGILGFLLLLIGGLLVIGVVGGILVFAFIGFVVWQGFRKMPPFK